MARLENDQGGAVYFNPILKHGKEAWVIKGIGDTVNINDSSGRSPAFLRSTPKPKPTSGGMASTGRHTEAGYTRAVVEPIEGPTTALILYPYNYPPQRRAHSLFSKGKNRPFKGLGGMFTLPRHKSPSGGLCGPNRGQNESAPDAVNPASGALVKLGGCFRRWRRR